jgi:molecular chaperone DnaJ
MQVATVCSRCGGSGRLQGSPCNPCNGTGRRGTEEKIKVRIPPGIEDGGKVRLSGKGNVGMAGGPAGDAYLVVNVEQHPMFRRQGRDIYCDVPIGIVKATLGGNIKVPTLEGSTTISLPAGTPSGRKFRLRGDGVPSGAGKPAGDLFAVIQIHPPTELDQRSRELLEELAERNPESE